MAWIIKSKSYLKSPFKKLSVVFTELMDSCSPGSSLLGFRAEHLFQFIVAPPCHLQGERQDYIDPRLGWSSSFACLLRGLWRNAIWFENTLAYRIVIVALGDGSKKDQLLFQKLGTERSTSRSLSNLPKSTKIDQHRLKSSTINQN